MAANDLIKITNVQHMHMNPFPIMNPKWYHEGWGHGGEAVPPINIRYN